MAAFDRKYVHIAAPELILQEGSGFTEGEPGQYDTGQKIYLTHPDTPRSKWPKRGDRDSLYAGMKVCRVADRQLECGLLELTISYTGAINGDKKPPLIRSGADTQMLSLPARSGSSSGPAAKFIAPVPVPTCTREMVVFVQPTTDGVGHPVTGDFLPPPPAFSLSFYPDPDEPFTLNYFSNTWVMQSRTWDNSTPNVWLVREQFAYYYSIAI